MIFVPLPESSVSWRRTPILWILTAICGLLLLPVLLSSDGEEFAIRWALHPESPGPATLFSSMFLHASIGHLVGNFLFLWGVGQLVHHRLGGWAFLAAFLLTGLAAGLTYILTESDRPVIGSSGAVSGLMGLYGVLWPGRRMRIFYWIGKGGVLRPRAFWALGLWVVLQAWLASLDLPADATAYSAHLGGFGAGAAAGAAFRFWAPRGIARAWALENAMAEQEVRARHLARAVMHNLKEGHLEPMGRAWADWASGPAHTGFTAEDLSRVHLAFHRAGQPARAAEAERWKRVLFGKPLGLPEWLGRAPNPP